MRGSVGNRPPGHAGSRAARLLLAAGLAMGSFLFAQAQEQVQDGNGRDAVSSDMQMQTTGDDATALSLRRDLTRDELQTLSTTIQLSKDRVAELEAGIAALDKTSLSLRAAIVESAAKRRVLEQKMLDGERQLSALRTKEDAAHAALRARRALFAEVLAALQRMGRNPPPALLVTPEDALGSVRSAILLGAVVPGIKRETEGLASALKAVSTVRKDIEAQKQGLAETMAASLAEERRMDLLIGEKQKLKQDSAAALVLENRQAADLAGKATSLQDLIGALEGEIASVRAATDAAQAAEESRRLMSEAERQEARERARTAVPDKNRIAPAYEFSQLLKKLPLPAAGAVLRSFGDDDGTGHGLQGMMIETGAKALVTAPSDSWVVFAGAFRSYGQMIILNPGDGYHLVLSGMESVDVQQGQFVVAGEPLGAMGHKRVASATALALETDRPTLYIEFRKDGKPVDSRPWWTAADSGKARNDS